MRYKENDIIRIGEKLYEVMGILNVKDVPGFDSDIFYNLRSLHPAIATEDRILVEAESIDQEHVSFLDTQYMREQRLNRILNDK